ncbi:MAG: O-antigen ligase family protein [Pseudomonadales bacterium]
MPPNARSFDPTLALSGSPVSANAGRPPGTRQFLGMISALTLASVFLLPMGADALLGLLMLVALFRWPQAGVHARGVLRDPLFGCAALLLGYLGASVSWSAGATWVDQAQVWLRITYVVAFLLSLSAALWLPGFLRQLCQLVTLAAAVSALICLVWFALGGGELGRLSGLFRYDNPGRAGRLFCAALPFIAMYWALEPGRRRWFAAAAAALVLAAMVATDTRSAWLGACLGLSALLFGYIQQSGARHVLHLGCAFALLAAAVLFAIQELPAIDWLFPRGDSFRLGIWSAYLRDVLAGPWWFGWGQATEHWVSVGDARFRGAHNIYLSVLGQVGVPGLILFLTLLGWSAVRLLRRLGAPAARLSWSLLVIGASVFMFSGDRIVDKVNLVWFVVWVPLAVALALRADGAAKLELEEQPR